MTLLIAMGIIAFVGHQDQLVIGKETNETQAQNNGLT